MDHQLVAVTAIGRDRPGIVAGVAKVLFESGCNLEDVTSTILGGHFSMMLVVRVPDDAGIAQLEAALSAAAEELDLTVSVSSVQERVSGGAPPTHMVSVYGADRPGIVYKVAELLSQAEVNITDLTSRVLGAPGDHVYALMLEVVVPENISLAERLDGLREELGVEVSIHPIDADLL